MFQDLRGIESTFVHEYQIYQRGTKADCNLGTSEEIFVAPCTVLSHVMKDVKEEDGEANDDVVYEVRAKRMDGLSEKVVFLPRMKVMRLLIARANKAVPAR